MPDNTITMTIRGARALAALLESGEPWSCMQTNTKDRSEAVYTTGDVTRPPVKIASCILTGPGADRFNALNTLVLLRDGQAGRVAAMAEAQTMALAMVVDLDGKFTTLVAQVTR